MDNRINEIRRKISLLRTEMVRVEELMRDQIRDDLDSTEAALQLIAMRTQLATLVAGWKAAGGSDPLPTIEERLKAVPHRTSHARASPLRASPVKASRPPDQKPKTVAQH